jgi:hypothetical protein
LDELSQINDSASEQSDNEKEGDDGNQSVLSKWIEIFDANDDANDSISEDYLIQSNDFEEVEIDCGILSKAPNYAMEVIPPADRRASPDHNDKKFPQESRILGLRSWKVPLSQLFL